LDVGFCRVREKVSNRAERKASKFVSGCAVLIWLAGLSLLIAPFQGHGGFAEGLSAVLAVAWTVAFIGVYVNLVNRARGVDERRKWTRQEATRLRKKAWREGRK
jgi:hypothetical protein